MLASTDRTPLTSEEFRNVMGHFASGVTVITADDDGNPVGSTASAFTSLSLDPPMVLVCLNKSSHTAQVIHATKRFGVNIVGEDGPDLAMRFAARRDDKFSGLDWHRGAHEVPLLDQALASVECSVVEETQGGTHYVFIAAAETATLHPGSPLAYYRGRFGRVETDDDLHAAQLISDRIIADDLQTGTVLEVDALSAALDIPRGTTYHALSSLTKRALVYRDEGGRFRVATPSTQMVAEAIEARRIIEMGIVTRGVDAFGREQLEELRAAAEPGDPDDGASHDESSRINRDFHDRLVALSDNEALINVYRQFNFTAIMGRIQNDAVVNRRDLSAAEEHMKLVEALERRDLHGAIAAIAHHAASSMAATRRLLDEPSRDGSGE